MKKVSLLLSLVLLFSLVPSAFALPQNLFNGSSLFEKLPTIEAGKTSDFTIKLFYKSGPYALEDLTPIIDIYPKSLTRYLTIKTESASGSLYPFSTVHIKGNITASPDIPNGKTSLLYYFVANDTRGNPYKSSWSDSSPALNIKTQDVSSQDLLETDKQNISHFQILLNSNLPPLKQIKEGIQPHNVKCKIDLELAQKKGGETSACVKLSTKIELTVRGWADDDRVILGCTNERIHLCYPEDKYEYRQLLQKYYYDHEIQSIDQSPLHLKIVGEKQVRRGTTHTIEVHVLRGDTPIEGARVFIDIEDYGEDIIKEFDGYTDSQGYFVLSWEIPQSFDDIETLLAFIDVTDGQSSKTELFKFQVYCQPGEKNCKAEGN
jgi:hypothetical protein